MWRPIRTGLPRLSTGFRGYPPVCGLSNWQDVYRDCHTPHKQAGLRVEGRAVFNRERAGPTSRRPFAAARGFDGRTCQPAVIAARLAVAGKPIYLWEPLAGPRTGTSFPFRQRG